MSQLAKLARSLTEVQNQLRTLASYEKELKEKMLKEEGWEEDEKGRKYIWDPSIVIVTDKKTTEGGGFALVREEPKPVLNIDMAEKLCQKKGIDCYVKEFSSDVFAAEVQGGAITEEELASVMDMSTPKAPYLKRIEKKPTMEEETM